MQSSFFSKGLFFNFAQLNQSMAEQIKTKKEEKPEKVMTFWDHLEELRGNLVRSLIAIVVLAIVAFLNREIIFDQIILAPSRPGFITNEALCWIAQQLNINALCLEDVNLQIINIKMSGQFLTHMYISIVAGVILSFP